MKLVKLLTNKMVAKLIIIGTSRNAKYADYYNGFKDPTIEYDTKLTWVLKDHTMWDIIIQDQRFVVLMAY
jgi:hypothetical protein